VTPPNPLHLCHWPGCQVTVAPKYWGCNPHWRKLPFAIRERIWACYRPGQEEDKKPSQEYVDAAREADEWIRANHPPKAPA